MPARGASRSKSRKAACACAACATTAAASTATSWRSPCRGTRPARSPRSTTWSASARSAFAAKPCRASLRYRACGWSRAAPSASLAYAIDADNGTRQRARAGGASGRDDRRSARPVLQRARAPQIPAGRAHRDAAHRAHGRAAGAVPLRRLRSRSRRAARSLADYPAASSQRRARARVAQIVGDEFMANALYVEHEPAGCRLTRLVVPADLRARAARSAAFLSERSHAARPAGRAARSGSAIAT